MNKLTNELDALEGSLEEVREKQESHIVIELENLKKKLTTIGDLNIDQIAELRLTTDRTNKKIKDDLE